MDSLIKSTTLAALGLLALSFAQMPRKVYAHCDAMDGPVVTEARQALEKGEVAPLLKWVHQDQEREIRQAFSQTLKVRQKGEDVKEMADRYFFETLVRVHRASEGAPYTGLKPAGTFAGPGVQEADKALETGSVDELVKKVTKHLEHGIRERFAHASESRKHAGHGVEAGRKFVAAYVNYVHYVKELYLAAKGAHGHGKQEAAHEAEHEAE